MIIYKHTCKATGKSYIGLTKYSIEHRLDGHIKAARLGSRFQFHKAIAEYGIEQFESEVLEDNITDAKILCERERYWIAFYDTYRNGYNMTEGGETSPPLADTQIEKMVKTRRENGSYITGAAKRMETIGDRVHDIIAKTTKTKRENGSYERLSEKVKGVGIGFVHTCEHCGKTVKGGNFFRWHGDNCKKNPNVTEEQLLQLAAME